MVQCGAMELYCGGMELYCGALELYCGDDLMSDKYITSLLLKKNAESIPKGYH